jgi:pimeloyl-ACP methyl ester carboxylesterase
LYKNDCISSDINQYGEMNKKIILSLLLASAASFSLVGCSHAPVAPPVQITPTLVFIQGVHLDGQVWDATKSEIDSSAFHVMDLDRLGRDEKFPASLKEIASLSCHAIPAGSILVGHSYGGAIANEMFGICPDKITKIIYLSAVIPLVGEKPFDKLSEANQKAYAKAVTFKDPKIIPRAPKKFFKATDKQVDLKKPLPRLYPEWMSLTTETVDYDVSRFRALPKVYLYTTKDPVISLETQKRYTERTNIQNTDSIATGHFAMISNPTALGELIQKWAKN